MNETRERSPGRYALLRVAAISGAAALFCFSSLVVYRHWRGEHLFSAALQLLETDRERAETLLQEALRHGTDRAAVELARLAYSRRDWRALHGHAQEALRLDPGLGYVNVLRAYALASERMPESPAEAEIVIGECRRAVSVDPTNANLWLRYAELSFRVSRHLSLRSDGSADGYRQESLAAYGRAFNLEGALAEKAVDDLIGAGGDSSFVTAAFHGTSPAALRRVAAMLLDRDEWDYLGEQFLTDHPEGTARRSVYRAAAEELRSRKRYADALEVLRDYAFAVREDAHLAFLAGLSAEALGPRDESWRDAEKYYRTALQLDKTRTAYRIRLGVNLMRGGDIDGAEKALRQATAESPDNPWAWFQLGQVLRDGGRHEEALGALRRASSLKPGNSTYTRALEALEKKVEAAPDPF